GIFDLACPDDLEPGKMDFIDDLVESDPLQIVGVKDGRREQKGEASEIVHISPRMRSMRAVGAFDDNWMTVDPGLRSRCNIPRQVFYNDGKRHRRHGEIDIGPRQRAARYGRSGVNLSEKQAPRG